MSKPKITDKPGGLEFSWEEEKLKITVSRIRLHKDGRVTGELLVTTSAPGYSPLLHQAQLNFTASRSMTSLANLLEKRYPDAEWDSLIEQLCYYTLDRVRRGEPVYELWTNQEIQRPSYLIYPILPMNQPTIIFGDPASGKSLVALVLAICMILPWYDNPLGLTAPPVSHTPLMLDYELDAETTRWRLKCLQEGMGLPTLSLNYRRCALPLAEDVEQIEHHVDDTKSDVIIIDSLGPACGGDLKDAETALRFFNALRQLKVTSLIIAHTSKERDRKTKTVFGSVFFEAISRSIWEIRSLQEHGESEIDIGLFHRKANISKLHHPLGFKMKFGDDYTEVMEEDARTIDEFLQRMSTQTRITEELKPGKRAVKDLAEALGIPQNTVSQSLRRMKSKGLVSKYGTEWGLFYAEEP